MLIEFRLTSVNVGRVSVTQIAIWIPVTGFENNLSVAISDIYLQPNQTLPRKPGGRVMAVRAISNLNPELYTVLVGLIGDSVAKDVTIAQDLQAFFGRPGKGFELGFKYLPSIEAVIREFPMFRKFMTFRYFVFKFIGSPSCSDIELQPLPQGRNFLRFIVMRKDARGKDGRIKISEKGYST